MTLDALADGFWITLIAGSIAILTLATIGLMHI
jgi:hypothetical protein